MPAEIADSDGEDQLEDLPEGEQLLSQEQQLHEEWAPQSPNLQQTANHTGFESGEFRAGGIGDEPAQEEQFSHYALAPAHGRVVQSELAAVKTKPILGRKRSHSTLEDWEDAGGSDQISQKQQRNSRAKTCGNSSPCMKSGQIRAPNEAFEEVTQPWPADSDPAGTGERVATALTSGEFHAALSSYLSMQPPAIVNPRATNEANGTPRQRDRPRRVLSLIQESMSDTSQEISTSRSSMGNYESININFRGTASDRFVDANPFGSMSQTSVEDEVHHTEREKMAIESGLDGVDIVALSHTGTWDLPSIGHGLEKWNGYNGVDDGGPYQMPGRSKSIDPATLHNDLPNRTQLFSSSKSPSDNDPKLVAMSSVSPLVETDRSLIDRSLSENGLFNTKSTTKKRGRKPKSQPLPSEPPGLLQEEEPAPDSDELAIGLSKKQYKPGPSRPPEATDGSLAKSDSPEPTTKKDKQSSPVKQPSSDLHLSDEVFIGLPKENYKPRPSRSRSKRTIMLDEDIMRLETVDGPAEAPISSAIIPDATDATPVKKPKRPVKKTKVKRAKTSAAALLKKSKAMLSEGEDDVLWLETKPSEVKLDLPPEIKRENDLGRKEAPPASSGCGQSKAAAEEGVTDEKGLEAPRQDEDTNAASQIVDAATASLNDVDVDHGSIKRADTAHIVVDIPPCPPSHVQVEPKKRGRKKKHTEILTNESDDLEEASLDSEASDAAGDYAPEDVTAPPAQPMAKKRGRKKKVADIPGGGEDVNGNTPRESNISPSEEKIGQPSRPVLAEKDPNRSVPPHIHHSKQALSDLASGSSSPGKENKVEPATSQLQTPHKQAPKDADSEKGPTKHSPINPSGGKALYRVGLSKRAAIPRLLKVVRKEPDKAKDKEMAKQRPEIHVPVAEEE